MKASEAAQILAHLKDLYPRQAITAGTLDAYTGYLADLDYQAVLLAVKKHVADSPYFPTISDLRKKATGTAHEGSYAETEWGEVMQQISRVGRYRTPAFSSEITEEAVKVIGWQVICNTEEDQIGVLRKHFYQTFETIKNRKQRNANVGPLLESRAVDQLVGGVVKRLKAVDDK